MVLNKFVQSKVVIGRSRSKSLSKKFTLRQGGIDDVDAIWSLGCQRLLECWSITSLKKSIQSGYALRLCFMGSLLVGYLLSRDSDDEVEVMQVVVATSFQRQGVAESLSRNLLAEKSATVRKFILEVRASNQAAQALYRKLDFVQVSIRKNYYSMNTIGKQEDAVVMIYQEIKGLK
ncbi:MAG: ribosomal protein S18-alanine N-acetyltransferase [Mariprofundaceae bacterium]